MHIREGILKGQLPVKNILVICIEMRLGQIKKKKTLFTLSFQRLLKFHF